MAITYIKLAEVFLFYLASVRAAAFFVIYCIIVWVISKNPIYPKENSRVIKIFSLEQFYFLVGALTSDGDLKHPPPTETTVPSKKRQSKSSSNDKVENKKDYSKI